MADSLVQRVAEILHRYSMIPEAARIGVAVSGGADSVVLLSVLMRLRERFPCDLTVLHINHGLRGAESEDDEEFVRDLAQAHGFPFISERIAPGTGNLEQAAREARRTFFQSKRVELGLHGIALGHTRSDQAETVLYRFLRGSGTAGLAAMRPVSRDHLIRPLLDVGREEVRAWARREGIGWREDASNGDPKFARNLLRNEAIPALAQQFNPRLEGVLAGTAYVAQAEEEYWEGLVSTAYAQITKRTALGSFLQIADLNALHPALQRRTLRAAVAAVKGDLRGIDLYHIESVLALAASTEGHDRVIIPGVDALRSYGTLLLMSPGRLNEAKRHYRVDAGVGRETDLPFGLGKVRLEATLRGLQNCANVIIDHAPSTEIAYLDNDALRGHIHVRNWEPGDGLRRPGHNSFEKLKTLFQENRILLWERRHWPVLVAGDELVWAKRFGCSANALAGPETQTVIRLEYSV